MKATRRQASVVVTTESGALKSARRMAHTQMSAPRRRSRPRPTTPPAPDTYQIVAARHSAPAPVLSSGRPTARDWSNHDADHKRKKSAKRPSEARSPIAVKECEPPEANSATCRRATSDRPRSRSPTRGRAQEMVVVTDRWEFISDSDGRLQPDAPVDILRQLSPREKTARENRQDAQHAELTLTGTASPVPSIGTG
jgi:hypothetical protein